MNNLYQDTFLDYSNYNQDFYKVAENENLDWSLCLAALKGHSNVSICELSRYLDGAEIPSSCRRHDTTPTRDHVEGVLIGKIVDLKPDLKRKITELAVKYVQPEKLRQIKFLSGIN